MLLEMQVPAQTWLCSKNLTLLV